MPRLRPRREQAPTPQLEGAMARCLISHTGPGGWIERGLTVPLSHANVAVHPEWFELVAPIPTEGVKDNGE
jgi:hypothetical protein